MNTHRAELPREEIGHIIKRPATRAYFYGVAMALIPVLVSIGAITNGTAALVANLIAALLAVTAPGVALANTPGVIKPVSRGDGFNSDTQP